MNGSDVCALEDELAVALRGHKGAHWVRVYLEIAFADGYRLDNTRAALCDLQDAQGAIEAALARLRIERGALPRGREYTHGN